MARLYKRFCQLSLIKPDIRLAGGAGFFRQLPNAVVIRELQVKFHIEKGLGKEPNKAEVSITNLAPTTRTEIEKAPLIVRLEVGYEGSANLELLFSGDLRVGSTEREGPDWKTKLLLGDGDRAYQFARVGKAFAAGTRILDAVTEITTQIGLPLPPAIKTAREFQNQYADGITLYGPAERELSTVLTPIGMGWSMQDGQLVILRDQDVREGEAIVIEGPPNGRMIGSPEFTNPKKVGEAPMLKVKTLLDPKIRAGGKIDVRSLDKRVNGVFRVEKLSHVGDTRGKEWWSEIEAKPV